MFLQFHQIYMSYSWKFFRVLVSFCLLFTSFSSNLFISIEFASAQLGWGWGGSSSWTWDIQFANDDSYSSVWSFYQWVVTLNDNLWSGSSYSLFSSPSTWEVWMEPNWEFSFIAPEWFSWQLSFDYELCQAPIAQNVQLAIDKSYDTYSEHLWQLYYTINYSHTWWTLSNPVLVDSVPDWLCLSSYSFEQEEFIEFSLDSRTSWITDIPSNYCDITDIKYNLPASYANNTNWSWSWSLWFTREDVVSDLSYCNTVLFSADNAQYVQDEACSDMLSWIDISTLWIDKSLIESDTDDNEITYKISLSHLEWVPMNPVLVDTVPEWLCFWSMYWEYSEYLSFSNDNRASWKDISMWYDWCNVTDIRYVFPEEYANSSSWSLEIELMYYFEDRDLWTYCNTAVYSADNAQYVEDEVCFQPDFEEPVLFLQKTWFVDWNIATFDVTYSITWWIAEYPVITDAVPPNTCFNWLLTWSNIDYDNFYYSLDDRETWIQWPFIPTTTNDTNDLSNILANLFWEYTPPVWATTYCDITDIKYVVNDTAGKVTFEYFVTWDDDICNLAVLSADNAQYVEAESCIFMTPEENIANLIFEKNVINDWWWLLWSDDFILEIWTSKQLDSIFATSEHWSMIQLTWWVEYYMFEPHVSVTEDWQYMYESTVCKNWSWDIVFWRDVSIDTPEYYTWTPPRSFAWSFTPLAWETYTCTLTNNDVAVTVPPVCDIELSIDIKSEVCLLEDVTVHYYLSWSNTLETINRNWLKTSWQIDLADSHWSYLVTTAYLTSVWTNNMKFVATDDLWCTSVIKKKIEVKECNDNIIEQPRRKWWSWWGTRNRAATSSVNQNTIPLVQPAIQQIQEVITIVPTTNTVVHSNLVENQPINILDKVNDSMQNDLSISLNKSWILDIVLPEFLPQTWAEIWNIAYAQSSGGWWAWWWDWWSSWLMLDDCPNWDYTTSFYDWECWQAWVQCQTATVTIDFSQPLECPNGTEVNRIELLDSTHVISSLDAELVTFDVLWGDTPITFDSIIIWWSNFDSTHIDMVKLYRWTFPNWTLVSQSSINTIDKAHLTFTPILVQANSIQQMYVTIDLSNEASTIWDTLSAELEYVGIMNTDWEPCSASYYPGIINDISITDVWYMTITENNSSIQESCVLWWEASDFVASFDLDAFNEDISVEDMTLTVLWSGANLFADAVRSVTIYWWDMATVLYWPITVTSNVINLNNNFIVPHIWWDTIYVKIEAEPIWFIPNESITWIQSWPFSFELSINDNDAIWLSSWIDMNSQTSTLISGISPDFCVEPVAINYMSFVSTSVNWIDSKAAEIWWLTTDTNVAILRINADDWMNTTMSWWALEAKIHSLVFNEVLWTGTSVWSYKIYKSWWIENWWYVWVSSWWLVTFDVSSSPDDFIFEATEILDLVIVAIWVTETPWQSDFVWLQIDSLSAWAITYWASDVTIPWYSIITDPLLSYDLLLNAPVTDWE